MLLKDMPQAEDSGISLSVQNRPRNQSEKADSMPAQYQQYYKQLYDEVRHHSDQKIPQTVSILKTEQTD